MKSGKMTAVLVIGAAMLLAACGGGGDSGTTSPPAAAAPLNGVFIDSPVQGLHYTAQPSNLSGFTDANGQYNYRTGDTVIFDIGGRPINTVGISAGPVVTALSVFGATSTADPQVVNLSRLLLTLAGGAPNGNNVIQLPATLPPLPSPINFNVPTTTFAANISAAGGGTGPTLVPESTATTHLALSFSTVSVTLAGTGSGSVASNPSGINCSINGGTSSGTCSAVLSKNFSVTLTPTGAGFAGWTGGTGSAAACSGTGPCTFTVTDDSNVTATFNVPLPLTLTISNAGTGTGTVNCSVNSGAFAPCAGPYANGTPIVLQATASPGSTFTGWSGGSGNAVACNITTVNCSIASLNTDTALTANFALQTVTFTLTTTMATAPGNGGGGTSITCSTAGVGGPFAPCAASYNAGTNLWLQANPNSVSNFTGWSTGSGNGPGSPSACNGTSGICNFSVTDASSITANFNRPTLTVTVVGSGSVSSSPTGINTCTASCAAVFDRGIPVTLTNNGTGFSGWTGACSGTGACQFPLNTNTTVQATFGVVSSAPTFKFIAAPGRELLAVNPASPGTPTPVKVNGANVILGNPPSSPGTTLDVSSGAALIDTASYNAATKTYTNLQRNTILFVSGGKFYKASALVSDGVPGSAPGNEPQQVSSLSNAVSCGVGSAYDVVNPNQPVGFLAPGANGICYDSDDQAVLMHLNDSVSSDPVVLPAGSVLTGDTVYDFSTGLALHTIVSVSGFPYWMDNSFTLTPITNGAGIGYVQVVAQQPDKVFVTNFTGLYLYTPSTHTLNPAPVAVPDAGTAFFLLDNEQADANNIFLVQTNGDVYKVPLSATSNATTTKLYTAPPGTVVQDVRLTTNKIAIATGIRPSDNFGSFNPCYTSNPRTCNNGIVAVDKITGFATTIEAAASAKTLWMAQSFDNYILYTRDNDPATGGLQNGAVLRIEDASSPDVLKGQFGGWGGEVVSSSVSWVTLSSTTVKAVFSQFTNLGPPATGTVSVISSPTNSPVLLGTVTSSPAVTNLPYFFESVENAMIGYAFLQASPTSHQPYFLDAALAGSLIPITTPGAAAKWQEVQD